MTSAKECRAKAREYRKLAETAVDPRTSFQWTRLAKAWEQSALEAVAEEALTESVADLEKDDDNSRAKVVTS